MKKTQKTDVQVLNVTAENFSIIRETLKSGKSANINTIITLVGFEPNTETLNKQTGKITRTPFYYVSEDGKKYTSTQLKEVLNIEPEKKGSRRETTFAAIFEQLKGLANRATLEELQEANNFFERVYKERKESEETLNLETAKAALMNLNSEQIKHLKQLGLI